MGTTAWRRLGEPLAFIMMFFWICDFLVAVAVAFAGGRVSLIMFRRYAENQTEPMPVTRANGSESR